MFELLQKEDCSPCAEVGSICRMQLRHSDIIVSPDILGLF